MLGEILGPWLKISPLGVNIVQEKNMSQVNKNPTCEKFKTLLGCQSCQKYAEKLDMFTANVGMWWRIKSIKRSKKPRLLDGI